MGLAASRQEAFWEACGFGNLERAKHFLAEGDIDVNWVSYTVCSDFQLFLICILCKYGSQCTIKVLKVHVSTLKLFL